MSRLLLIAALFLLPACEEEETPCQTVAGLCAACDDSTAVEQCASLLRKRDQVACSIAVEELEVVCGPVGGGDAAGEGGAAGGAMDAAGMEGAADTGG